MELPADSLHDLLDSAPDATVIVNQAGQVVFANAQVKNVFGYSSDELVGTDVEVLLPDRYKQAHGKHRDAFVRAPRVRPMGAGLELFGRRKDGSEFPIEISLSPVQTSEGLLISSAVRDVTERKTFETVLSNAKEAAERATATKSRFLAAASHDLRQPLQSISIYLDVLQKTISVNPDVAREVCAKVDKSLDVMGELLDALLDISKLDSGSITPEKRDFEMQPLLDALHADNAPAAEEKGLLLVEPSRQAVHTDPALLQRILENFVTNAIRYTESGTVRVSCTADNGRLRVAVEDTGIGIPSSSLDTIFEEYFQLDNPVRDRRKGLGLGLSIVKHIAELLEDPLEVTSTVGKGSTFAVTVPIGQPIEQHEIVRPDREARTRHRVPVILFVDDDPAIVDATCMMLDLAGIKSETALDGSVAIEMLESGLEPDMVVSDFRLPGANGVDVVRRARELLGPTLPLVMMTGDTSGKAIEAAKLTDCIVLRKPVDTRQLIETIESALSPAESGAHSLS